MSDNTWKAATPYITGAIGAVLFGPIGGMVGLALGKGMTASDHNSSDYNGDYDSSDDGMNHNTSDFNSYSDPQYFTDYFH